MSEIVMFTQALAVLMLVALLFALLKKYPTSETTKAAPHGRLGRVLSNLTR